MTEEIKVLDQEIKKANHEIEELKKKAYKAEIWIKAFLITAAIFGLAGAYGFKLLSSAKKELDGLQSEIKRTQLDYESRKNEIIIFADQQKKGISEAAHAKISEAFKALGAGERLVKIESRLSNSGASVENAASGRTGLIRDEIVANCGAGNVVKGVKLHLGGTCNNQCNGDGQPVSQLELICVKQ